MRREISATRSVGALTLTPMAFGDVGETPIAVSPDTPLPVAASGLASRPAAVEVTHLHGVTVAGATEVLPADSDRFALTVRNASDTQMRMRVDGQEAGPDDYPLDAGRGYEFPPNMVPAAAVSVFCATAGKAWNIMLATSDDDA